ncbi:hypothetical protein VNI00_010093 [Paramarasmius palmivorus]|uniref:Uncharacterized protein n=1 Tax=Paramarasmius palmivorus TaxID=297713 RepID=A0AAW0CHC5_9AGAR
MLQQSESIQTALRDASKEVQLDLLLVGLLKEAPSESGQRYIAVALHIAKNKPKEESTGYIVQLAQAWLDHLIMPMRAISLNRVKTVPTGSQTPTVEKTATEVETATRKEQERLRSEASIKPSLLPDETR